MSAAAVGLLSFALAIGTAIGFGLGMAFEGWRRRRTFGDLHDKGVTGVRIGNEGGYPSLHEMND